jgi:hypothetical protein
MAEEPEEFEIQVNVSDEEIERKNRSLQAIKDVFWGGGAGERLAVLGSQWTKMVLVTETGDIPTRKDFGEIVESIQRFYDDISDEEIDDLNAANSFRWRLNSVLTEKGIGKYEHRGDWPEPGFIYILKSAHGSKIGKTKHVNSRMRFFEIKLPFPVSVEILLEVRDMSRTEKRLHDYFEMKHINGEWYDLTEQDYEYIRAMDTLGLFQ